MRTIFVVDDNQTNLLTAKSALEETYRTITMPSAARMFELVGKIWPDIILLDVEMPEMDGFETLKKLRSNIEYAHIPVIFLTAYSGDTIEELAFGAGAKDLIIKPFTKLELLNRVGIHMKIVELHEYFDSMTKKLLFGEHRDGLKMAQDYLEMRKKELDDVEGLEE